MTFLPSFVHMRLPTRVHSIDWSAKERRRSIVLVIAAILLFCAISVDHLGSWPPVGEDEPWVAAAPYKLVTQGVYGNDLFAGYYGSEHRLYNLVPLYPMMLAGVFQLGGVGVEQMRLLPVAFGSALLIILFIVGRQILDTRVAMLSVGMMLLLCLTASSIGTGIPLFDVARINRPDIVVPVFGLLGYYFFNRGEQRNELWSYLLAGMMIGLSALCNLYGAFWLPALLVLLLLRRGWRLLRQPEPYMMLAGFCITSLLPLAIYLAPGWRDYRGQSQVFAGRFDVLHARFYLDNLLHEFERFKQLGLVRRSGAIDWLRPGGWMVVVAVPLALVIMLRRGHTARYDGAFSVAVVLLVQSLLFALLLSNKSFSYFIALWPLVLLSIAWLGIRLWERSQHRSIRIALLVALLALVVLEGALRIRSSHIAATEATPYESFESRVAAYIPHGSRVLGLQRYWLGLRQFEYRSWVLPILLSEPGYYHEPLSLDGAIERIAPDVILIDRHMRKYLDEIANIESPRHRKYEEFRRYMQRHPATLVGTVEDSTYGRMEIYRIRNSE